MLRLQVTRPHTPHVDIIIVSTDGKDLEPHQDPDLTVNQDSIGNNIDGDYNEARMQYDLLHLI